MTVRLKRFTACFFVVVVMLTIVGCTSPDLRPNRNPVGEKFPRVVGEALNGPEVILPDDLAGKPAVLLVGYVQNAQFDADRWLLGLLQSRISVAIREVPVIEGLMIRLLAGVIDGGMRKGIPSDDWASVITVYGGADQIVEVTGNSNPRNIRVLLLDSAGKICWFHDQGYSARVLLELKAKVDELNKNTQ